MSVHAVGKQRVPDQQLASFGLRTTCRIDEFLIALLQSSGLMAGWLISKIKRAPMLANYLIAEKCDDDVFGPQWPPGSKTPTRTVASWGGFNRWEGRVRRDQCSLFNVQGIASLFHESSE